MSEDNSTCQIYKKHSSIECRNPALPADPDGLCILHSQNTSKDLEAFRAALEARYQEDSVYYNFRAVFFPGDFDPAAFFGSREFRKPVDFSKAVFKGNASFFRATFEKFACFSEATFEKGVNFSGAIFAKGADFRSAFFKERCDFFKVTFSENANFSKATIKGRVVFGVLNPPAEKNHPPPAFQGDFEHLKLNPEAVLRFQNLSLAQVLFAGTDLRQLEFQNVQWHPYWGRQAIYDEILLRKTESEASHSADHISIWIHGYGEVERLYRDLQANYEKARDYKKMGDFHYGEMEMHRRASKWRWFPFYWYNLYWFLSGYGERPSRAFGLLILFFAVLTGLLTWTGLYLEPKHIPALGDSFFYLLQKVTLQRPTWAEPMGFGGKLVAGFSVLLIPGQAALFLLALRNRLGRRR